MKSLAKMLNKFSKRSGKAAPARLSKQELEKKVIEGTKRAAKEYKETFKILASYDRT